MFKKEKSNFSSGNAEQSKMKNTGALNLEFQARLSCHVCDIVPRVPIETLLEPFLVEKVRCHADGSAYYE